ncbi:MAG: acid phosphatase, partial [Pseudomonas orientalis]|nr:acid phosphatase [Pseudomonas orientalis]
MSDEHEDRPSTDSVGQPPVDSSRRRFLGGAAVLGVGATLSGCGNTGEAPEKPAVRPLTSTELDKALRDQVKTVVVIYAENRSFNNLFADFPGLEKPLSALSAADYQQRDRDGSVLPALPQTWGGVLQAGPQSVDGVTYPSAVQFQENLPNAPFALKGPNAEDLPLSLVTRDLWHVFYQNQMQINGGKNDGFVAWGDSGGLVMGHYAQSRYSLRLWDVAREFVLCDNFFQGAFGGSFLNHQYLISATAPTYPNAAQSVAKAQIATLQSDDPGDTRLKPLDTSP